MINHILSYFRALSRNATHYSFDKRIFRSPLVHLVKICYIIFSFYIYKLYNCLWPCPKGPPLFPMAVIMMVELAAYAGLVSFSRQRRLVENRSLAQILCLLIAMLGGRIAAGLVVFVLSLTVAGIQLSPLPYLIGAVTKGLPGIILQLIFIPSLLLLLNKARVYDN